MLLAIDVLDEAVKGAKAGEMREHPEPAFVGAQVNLAPRESKTIEFVVDKVGRFAYACLEEKPELHASLGMRAIIIVEA